MSVNMNMSTLELDQFFQMIKDGEIEPIAALIERGLDVNLIHRYTSLLYYALANEQHAVARLLYEHGANLVAISDVENTDLLKATSLKIYKIIDDLEQVSFDYLHPVGELLNDAAWNGDFDTVKKLVSLGVDIDYNKLSIYCYTSDYEDAPLYNATSNNHTKIAKFLIDNGANVTLSNVLGERAYHVARREKNDDLVQFIVEHEPIHLHDYQTRVATLLEMGLPIEIINYLGHTNKRVELQGIDMEYIVFRDVFEITSFTWCGYVLIDLLSESGIFDPQGILCWCPTIGKIVGVSMGSNLFMVPDDVTWDQFLHNPEEYLNDFIHYSYDNILEDYDFDAGDNYSNE
ncbi:ankyrin repeat domain-containing protein [Paenibacillus agilis]|uniref:Ankyrin repeat domain-containing protein n=1 Tax=Paenibacillus agilis TaxID=3020863 RepID=A0A559J043_9BACL|nr:ankyrin repeat domain-containing protein [Paenibacillus agilis]TVX93233.1 hypothetical protein FPZ44_09285 [Paenibacillus agilis]